MYMCCAWFMYMVLIAYEMIWDKMRCDVIWIDLGTYVKGWGQDTRAKVWKEKHKREKVTNTWASKNRNIMYRDVSTCCVYVAVQKEKKQWYEYRYDVDIWELREGFHRGGMEMEMKIWVEDGWDEKREHTNTDIVNHRNVYTPWQHVELFLVCCMLRTWVWLHICVYVMIDWDVHDRNADVIR